MRWRYGPLVPHEAGGLQDAQGIHHDSMDAFLSHVLGLCGCSEEEPVFDRVESVLSMLAEKNHDGLHEVLGFERDPATYYLVLGLLEDRDLIEHGTSIRYPWLTDAGEWFLARLRERKKVSNEPRADRTADVRRLGLDPETVLRGEDRALPVTHPDGREGVEIVGENGSKLLFPPKTPTKLGQCCERDDDFDGVCPWHPRRA